MEKKELYIISGQTATGKTEVALALAKKVKGSLISADSRQAYKYLDIISGKDVAKSSYTFVRKSGIYDIGYYTIDGVPVWLYDMCNPHSYLSAYDWARCASDLIYEFVKSGITPIIVGGSWFYLHALLYGISTSSGPNTTLRKFLQGKTVLELQEEVIKINSTRWESLNNSDRNNPRRLIRIIELGMSTKGNSFNGIYQQYLIKGALLLCENSNYLNAKIDKRVQNRIHEGAFDEVELLLSMGYHADDPGLQTIGYQQLMRYLNDTYSRNEAVLEWVNKEHQYAKRQKTFMKKNTQLIHINPEGKSLDELLSMIY